MARFLIIGAGISGCTAGLELANQGGDVEIIEKSGQIGGRITGYSCKATDDCSRCGVCTAHIRFKDSIQHKNIRFTTGASVNSVLQQNGKTEVTVIRSNPCIDLKKCSNCDACLQLCPNNCITKYSRAGFSQYIIDYSGCLLHQGRTCSVCSEACPSGAIYSAQKETVLNISCDAVLLASGHEPYDAAGNILYGYNRIPGVITGTEAEEILSRQNNFGDPGGSIAFIQCVGSRNPALGRNYCSAVCCAYALKIAGVLKHRNPAAEITVYFIDIQNFDKTFSLQLQELKKRGIHFVRGLPFRIEQSLNGRIQLLIEQEEDGNRIVEHDTVVLSTGLGPAAGAEALAEKFRLKTDQFGFYLPESSSLANIFVSGTCRTPQNIFDSITQAESSALDMLKCIKPERSADRTEDSTEHSGEVMTIPLSGNVLIIGDGDTAADTAREIGALGYGATLLCGEESRRGSYMSDDVRVITGGSLIELNGHVGSFKAVIRNSEKEMFLEFGAVVLASEDAAVKANPYKNSSSVIPMSEIEDTVSNIGRKKGARPIGLVLDLDIDEPPSGMEDALNIALRLQRRGLRQVHLFCREAKVSGPGMELLYNRAREAGVDIVKFENRLEISEDESGASIRCTDSVLRKKVSVDCDFIGISRNGLAPIGESELARITGVLTDAQGVMQDNNIHLLSCKTNRPGIFIAGPCRGSSGRAQFVSESKAAALAVHSLLRKGEMDVEISNAVVDQDKCILCLTCIRTCPFNAMEIDREKGAAKSIPEACQRCGTCVGECPARAIELPLFSDQLLLDQISSGYTGAL